MAEYEKQQEISKDWNFKYLVTDTYFKSLNARFNLEQYMKGLPVNNPRVVFAEFTSYVSAFYSTIQTDFNNYLLSKENQEEPPFTHEQKPFRPKDYLNLFNETFDDSKPEKVVKVLMMFNLLKYFCDTKGVFDLKNERHGPEEAFKYD